MVWEVAVEMWIGFEMRKLWEIKCSSEEKGNEKMRPNRQSKEERRSQ